MKFSRRPAFSMVELIFGMAVSTILLGALTSAMVIATRAVPDVDSPLTAAIDGAAAVDQMTTDLFTAHTITASSATMLEFQVADRNNDGCPETIRYEWSGVAGEALKRKYNDATAQTAVADVYEFELMYDATTLGQSFTSAANESNETLLASNVGAKLRTDWPVTSTSWIGQHFHPTLPADAVSWKVTRVEFLARVSGTNDGIARVELRYPGAGSRPTGALIADANLLERELPTTYLWRSAIFTSTPAISPASDIAFVVKSLYGAQALDVQYQQGKAVVGSDALVYTSNAGGTWTAATNQGLLYKVYGTATAASKPTVSRIDTVNSVYIKLRAGTNDAARVETTVPLPNEPEVTGA